MDIDEWEKEEEKRLRSFVSYWKEHHCRPNSEVSGPDVFPIDMPAGEWDEQYRSFTE